MKTQEVSDQLQDNIPVCRAFGCPYWDNPGSMIFASCSKYKDVQDCLMSCIDNTTTLTRNYISVGEIYDVTDEMVEQGLHTLSLIS